MADNLTEAQLRLRLIAEIEKHMPSAAHPYSSDYGFSKPSELYEQRLSEAFRAPRLPFGLGPSEEEWQRVRKAATELQRALLALRHDGFIELNSLKPLWWGDDKPLLYEAHVIADLLVDAAKEMETKRKAGPKANGKRNWEAAALAKVARRIWAEQEWESRPETYGTLPKNWLVDLLKPETIELRRRYSIHLENFAPRWDKDSALGPFGRFLEDVLHHFNCDILPSSAMRSLQNAEEKLKKVSRTASEI